MDVVATIAGLVTIALGLRDMFHTLLRPEGKGHLSPGVLALAWRVSKATGHRAGSAVGPAGMVLVIGLWVLLQTVGWALIYLPHMPQGFTYSDGVPPGDHFDFAEALYVSLMTLTTLGYGDVVATQPWIRGVMPLEALTGFALLTTALTWFSQIHPPLSRRRALALRLHGMAESGYLDAVDALGAVALTRTLDALATEVADIRVDFVQHSEGYFFQEQDPKLALSRQVPYALAVRDAAMARPEAEVRQSAKQLTVALDELATGLRAQFLRSGDETPEILEAYADDHGRRSRA